MNWLDDYDEYNEEAFWILEEQYPVPSESSAQGGTK